MMLAHPERIDVREMRNLNARAIACLAGPGGGKTTTLEQWFYIEGQKLGVLGLDPGGELARRLEPVEGVSVVRLPEDYATRRVGNTGKTVVEWIVAEVKSGGKVCVDMSEVWGSVKDAAEEIVAALWRSGARNVLLILEECQEYLSQGDPSESILRAFAIGRNRAWGRILATQRPADVDKRALERTDTQFLGRIQGYRDAAAVDALLRINVASQAERQAILAQMAQLGPGQFLLREPAHPPGVNA